MSVGSEVDEHGGTGVGAPLRIGVLGCARITEHALVAPARDAGHRLVAVAARDRDRAEAFAQEHGVERVHDTYADVLADPDVEVVYNPLPNGLHGYWNRAAIAAGKHVLSEKPFAANAGEAAEVRDAAVAAGVTVLEAFHYLYHPVWQRLVAIVASGELGTVLRVESHFRMPAPPDDDPRWSLRLAGGALMDIGCYALHIQRTLAPFTGGAPVVEWARGGERAGQPGVDEWIEAALAFPGGAAGLAHCHMAAPELRITCKVVGTEGEVFVHNVVLPQFDDTITVRTAAGERVEHPGGGSTYTHQLAALHAHLRSGTPLPLDVDDAVATAELIDAVYRAAGFPPRPRTPVPARTA